MFNSMYDLIQGRREADIFSQGNVDNRPRTLAEAIKEVLKIDYNGKTGSNIVGVGSETGIERRRGSTGDVERGGRGTEGERAADGKGRAKGDAGEEGVAEKRKALHPSSVESKDNQGNPINADGTLRLEKVKSVDDLTDEDFSKPYRNVELPELPKNVDDAIGANGKPIIIKKNIFEKNGKSHKDLSASQSREILTEALYHPNLYGQNQKTSRPYNWILIHNAEKHSSVILEVSHNKDNVEIVNWHYLDDVTLKQKERQAVKEGGLILTLESAAGNTHNNLSSGGKVTAKASKKQGKGKKKVEPGQQVDYYSAFAEQYGLDAEEAKKETVGNSFDDFVRDSGGEVIPNGVTRSNVINFAERVLEKYPSHTESYDTYNAKRTDVEIRAHKLFKSESHWFTAKNGNFIAVNDTQAKACYELVAHKDAQGHLKSVSVIKYHSFDNALTDEEVVAITDVMKANATVAPTVEINDANWKESVDTPIGAVKMGENQKAKLFAKGREQQYGMLLETLSNPDVVLEEKDKEQNMFHERPSSYLFVKTFQKEDGSKYVHFESVTVSQEGMEVSISSHIIRENQLKNKLKSDRLLYKATALDAPANTSAEQPIVGGSLSSDGKDTEKVSSGQEDGEKNVLSDLEREFQKALEHEEDVEQKWEDKIQDYVAEHYPTQATVSAATTSAKGVQEREAMKSDHVLRAMREKADAEYKEARDATFAAQKKMKTAKEKMAKVRLQKDEGYSEFADKHGVSADDVRRYAEGMASGNLALANQAIAEIRRSKRIEHRGTKLSEFAKLFAPLKNELYERFGDMDELQQEYVRRAEEKRNIMEAARRKAAEEEAKRKQHLEELSLLTSEEIDRRYADAIDKGDEQTAREMLDEAARRKGYGDTTSDYQGVGAWSAPSDPGYESDAARRADVESNAPDVNLEDMALGYNLQPDDYFIHPERYSQNTPHGLESTRAIQSALEALKRGEKDVKVKVYRAVPTSVKEGKLRNGDWVTPSKKYAEMHGNNRLEGKYRIIEDEVPVSELWWDGNDANEWGYDNGKGYKYKNVKNNRKSDALVTRDDNGNVIPPSKRFNQRKADERYQRGVDGVKPSKAEVVLRDAVIDRLRESGIEVLGAEGQKVLDMANGKDVRLEAKRKRALETASVSRDEKHQPTVVSSADGAKILNNLDTLATEYDNLKNYPKTFTGDVAKALGADRFGSGSEYATFETKNGQIVTIRLANHNARVSGFDHNKRDNGISIVISSKPNAGITNNGDAHIVEFYYDTIKLRRADGKPLAEIVRSIKQALYSGVFKDPTGLAERQEVNADDVISLQKVYHGSGADFDHFGHSHMGEGEGAQAYGWGTYVTEVKGIGRTYAEQNAGFRGLKDVGDVEERLMEKARSSNYDLSRWAATSLVDRAERLLRSGAETYYYWNVTPKELLNFVIYDAEGIESELLVDTLRIIEPEDLNFGTHNLYTVEIPDDTGENYLDWDAPIGNEQIASIRKYLSDNYRKQKIEDFDASIAETKNAPNADEVNAWVRRGENVYKTLAHLLGSDKEASKALSEMGFVGIKYPAQYRSGGRKDGAKNYVIFDEKDAKITDHVRFFKTKNGEAYGFTVGGKIYIDPRIANAETPIHEYAHLWASALRSGNPKEWENVVGLMKGTPVWEEVKKRYPELETDDEIADEVIATYSGRRGAERLRSEAGKIAGSMDELDAVKALSALQRVKEALKRFWKGVCDFLHIHFTSAEEVADRVMKDLLDGVDPRKFMKGKDGRPRFQFIGEKGATEADKAEEQTIRMDNLNVAKKMEEAKKDAKAIKMATGWERGSDGKWRYEMPDAKIKDTIDVGGGNIVKRFEEDMLWTDGKLEDAVDAPKLFEAYPQLKNIKIHTDAVMNDMPSNGFYNPQTNTITIHADELKYLNSILNHEVQHAIQNIEGFAKGGNSETVRSRIQRIIDEEKDASEYAKSNLKQYAALHMLASRLKASKQFAKSDQQFFKDKAREYYWDAMNELDNNERSTLINEYPDDKNAQEIAESGYHVDEAIKELKRIADEYKDEIPKGNMDAFEKVNKLTSALENKSDDELYQALAGEVEARNVQKRMGMTPEERRNSLAEETEDVSRGDQIVMNNGGTSYSIVKDPETIKKLDKEDTVKVYRAR